MDPHRAQGAAVRDPYRVLGVRPGCTEDELHAAFRLLASRYHPDRHIGSTPAMRREAERRMRDVSRAYHDIRARIRGIAGAPPPAVGEWRCRYCGAVTPVDRSTYKRWQCSGCEVHAREIRCPRTGEWCEVFWWGRDTIYRCGGCGGNHLRSASMSTLGPGCFVATAVYGDPMAPEVEALRRYRDDVLARRRWGRAVIKLYTSIGPPASGLVQRSPALRRAARALIDRLAARVSRGTGGAAGRRG